MEFEFLRPIEATLLENLETLSAQQLGRKIVFNTKEEFPNLDVVNIALIGIVDNRGNGASLISVDLTKIRQELYALFPGNWDGIIADLGDIMPGETRKDTYFVLRSLIAILIEKKIVPIVLGGSQDLIYPIYRAYDGLREMINLVAIDNKLDFGKENEPTSANSYLTKMVIEEPNNLFNYCNLGYQTYHNSQEEIDLIDKLFFDAYRLGDISNNTKLAEPVFRDADIVSLDLNCIKSSESGNYTNFQPNGFDGKEICSLSRYAGISDKVTTFGIFNYANSAQEAVLIAQIIWYFIEGFHCRSNEYPFEAIDSYLKYTVPSEEQTLVFYKSNKTDRWWIEIPFFLKKGNKLKRNSLLPCSYEEYLSACDQELPIRWWKALKKNNI